METTLHVQNAGIVLLNAYIPKLFERLALVQDGGFVSRAAQHAAVFHLHYLATGTEQPEETQPSLSNILCGLPAHAHHHEQVAISPEAKELANSLLKATIASWPEVSPSSVEGFRETWLMRNGKLHHTSGRWQLTVEKRSYDVLLTTYPFIFDLIHYPWMENPLHVTWM